MVEPSSPSTSVSVLSVFAFLIWTLLSFAAHSFARDVLDVVKHSSDADPEEIMYGVMLLTLFQVGIGAGVLWLACRIESQLSGTSNRSLTTSPTPKLIMEVTQTQWQSNGNGILHNGHAEKEHLNGNGHVTVERSSATSTVMTPMVLTTLALTHAVATATTNASIAFATPVPAFVVKSFEPISTAFLVALLAGNRIDTHVLVSLPLVICGAVGFSWKPTFQSSNLFGIVMALISNVTYGVRNIGTKSVDHGASLGRRLHTLRDMSLAAAGLLAIIVFIQSIVSPHHAQLYFTAAPGGFWSMLGWSVASGLFHVSYTLISVTVMLKLLSVVAHATANLGKRVLISLLFFMLGFQWPSALNGAFGVIFLLGIYVYSAPPRRLYARFGNSQEGQSVILAFIFTVFLLATVLFPTSLPRVQEPTPNSPAAVAPNFPQPANHQQVQSSSNNCSALLARRRNACSLIARDVVPPKKIGSIPVDHTNFELLYPNYVTSLSYEEEEFLDVDLSANPDRADWLSKRLPVASDVVLEASRVHYHLFHQLTRGYKRAVLVNVFTWANRGDHLITVGERVLLQRFNLSLVYYCFYAGEECDFSGISRSKDLIVFIQGAGYIGHEAHLPIVSRTLREFPKNRVAFFPISVCCTSKEELGSYADAFKGHPDFWLLLRDRVSYEISKKSFTSPTTHNLLSPDAAFAVGTQHITIVPVHDINWVKRDDWENYRDQNHDGIPKLPKNMSIVIQDWDEHFMDQTEVKDFMEEHQLKTASALIYLARAKVVITDRLHAHLMSTLLSQPNIVINSKTRKQQNYYDTWEAAIKTSACVDSTDEALSRAIRFISTPGASTI